MGVFLGTKEAFEKRGAEQDLIVSWCRQGEIDGTEQDKKGSPWRIPADAAKPKGRIVGK